MCVYVCVCVPCWFPRASLGIVGVDVGDGEILAEREMHADDWKREICLGTTKGIHISVFFFSFFLLTFLVCLILFHHVESEAVGWIQRFFFRHTTSYSSTFLFAPIVFFACSFAENKKQAFCIALYCILSTFFPLSFSAIFRIFEKTGGRVAWLRCSLHRGKGIRRWWWQRMG